VFPSAFSGAIWTRRPALQGDVDILKVQVGELSTRFDRLAHKVDLLIEAFFAFRDEVRARFDALEERVERLELRMDAVEDRLDSLETGIASVERRLDKVEVTLEEHGGHIRQLAEANSALLALIERRHQETLEHFEFAIREHSAVVRYHNLTSGTELH
jgi:chromosome segregation ATPase